MRSSNSSLDEFISVDVLRVVWDVFGELARRPESMDASTYYHLVGDQSVCSSAFDKCSEAGLIPANVRRHNYAPFRHVILKVFYSALSMGLLLPSNPDEALDWNNHSGVFHFTMDGVEYFSDGFVCVDDPGHLSLVLFDLKSRAPIDDGQIELLLEAQRCVRSGCSRAAMVVIGVASESACLGLGDAIPAHCVVPATGTQLFNDWSSCCNTALSFSSRWKPAVRILEAIKKSLRSKGKGEPWRQWWEMVPGSLFSLGEAVRVSRNAAAHDHDRVFSKAEAALLLSAMPTQLEMVARLTEFLQGPPQGLATLKI